MAWDPLSDSTRRSRNSMLVFSVSLFAVTAFGVKVSSLSGLAVELSFPEGVVAWLLGIAAIYFAFVFIVCIREDISADQGCRLEGGLSEKELKLLKRIISYNRRLIKNFDPEFDITLMKQDNFNMIRSSVSDCERALNIIGFNKVNNSSDFYDLKEFSSIYDDFSRNKKLTNSQWDSLRVIISKIFTLNSSIAEEQLEVAENVRFAAIYTFRMIAVEITAPLFIFTVSIISWTTDCFEPILLSYISSN